MPDNTEQYDYIVVGAGTAGSIVATRLTEDPKTTVLLLEAGPEDRSYWSRIPLGFAKIIFNEKYMWRNHVTEPEPHLDKRSFPLPHGKLIGGSSAINGLVHVRGPRSDTDTWEKMGAAGWGFDSVLPYFKKYECYEGGDDAYHGRTGPIGIQPAQWKNPLADAFIDAATRALGIPRNPDFNGESVEGAGYWDLTAWKGRRTSTSRTYIKPNRSRPNFHVSPESFVTRIDFEGREATGVTYERDGQTHRARARREVILSAGTIQSTQLLQLSGVGPGTLLQKVGVPVVYDAPGVGENLADHMQAGRMYSTSSPYTFNTQVGNVLRQGLAGIKFYLGPRVGPLTIGAAIGGAFFRTRQELEWPDVQLHLLPFMPGPKGYDLADESGFRLAMYQCIPKSRGYLRIDSLDPRANPKIRFNHLAEEEDVQTLLTAMKMAKKIAEAMPKDMNIREEGPGKDGDTDDGLLAYIRQNGDTSFHFCGTARMGTDEKAVVDPQLRVRGVGRLRVIDASVMPTPSSGNIQPVVHMIAEKGADLVKAG